MPSEMKTSRLHTRRASEPKFPRNPTSTATTVCQYAVLLYLALNYILHDNPRHVQYGEKVGQSQHPTLSTKHSQTPPTKSRRESEAAPQNSNKSNKSPIVESDPQDSRETTSNKPFSQPSRHSRDSLQYGEARPTKTNLRDPALDVSRVQMSEAWARIRAVSRIPETIVSTQRATDKRKKLAKKVRWGVVQTHQFESDGEADNGESKPQSSTAGGTREPEDQARRDLRASIEIVDEHDPRRPTEGKEE
jgi:hypothetical protein